MLAQQQCVESSATALLLSDENATLDFDQELTYATVACLTGSTAWGGRMDTGNFVAESLFYYFSIFSALPLLPATRLWLHVVDSVKRRMTGKLSSLVACRLPPAACRWSVAWSFGLTVGWLLKWKVLQSHVNKHKVRRLPATTLLLKWAAIQIHTHEHAWPL